MLTLHSFVGIALRVPMTLVLPIDDVIADIASALTTNIAVLLSAAPGAGKTTRVPLALLDADWLAGQRIIMLEPRRMAARNAATYMAQALNEAVGQTVGYRIRLENKISANTRIEVVTEGILTRMLQDDPELTGVGLVIFDEFHERHMASDLALALCHQCQQVLRPDLRILVMSATLDESALASALNAPTIRSEGRSYPVTTHYRSRRDANERLPQHMVRVINEALVHDDHLQGDLLVFLPGQGDIQRVQRLLEETLPANIRAMPLHGQLSDAEQKAAIRPSDEFRKIILATNIAESSLTIDGVSIVIDSGLERRMVFSPGNGVSELTTQGISKASATQREGRAGRQAPGLCYRLWSEQDHQGRKAHIQAEIAASDLAPLQLELLQWGAAADELLWLTPPPAVHLQQAHDLLSQLGLTAEQQLTEHGRRCAQLGLEPRWANALWKAAELGMAKSACELVALLQEPGMIRQQDDIELALLRAKQHPSWNNRIQPLAKRWSSQLTKQADSATLDVGFVIACAWPDRIAKRRGSGGAQSRYQLSRGIGAELLHDSSLDKYEWLAIADLAGGSPNKIRLAAPLSSHSIALLVEAYPQLFNRHIEVSWQDNGQLLAEEQQRLGALVFSAKRLTNLNADDWQNAWCSYFNNSKNSPLNDLHWTDNALNLRQRLALLHRYSKDKNEWPDVSDTALSANINDWLMPFLNQARHVRDLAKVNVMDALLSLLSWEQQQTLNRLLPTHIQVPSGSNIAIDYSTDIPILAVKLQEMFGYEGQPTVLNGQIALMIHLLSPARRPLQVTQDLPHFWRNSYADVRKDMRGRYPRHPWPEDPLSAEATRYTKARSKS